MSKTAFLFPGQGVQTPGMGKDFYENSPEAKAFYEKASECLGLDLKELCFTENDRLNQTEYTQPALTATCLVMAREAMKRGLVPQVTAGLSLGEYSALAVAGGMTDLEAVEITAKRGRLMEYAVPLGQGAMAAVLGLTGEAILKEISGIGDVSIANYNCPGQIVITGLAEGVAQAGEVLLKAGARKVIPLKVSGPFHSPFLRQAGEQLSRELAHISLNELNIPYVTNVTGEYVKDIRETKALLSAQVASSVLWQQSMERLIADGVDKFVEIGPGRTLTGFLKKISRSVKVYNISSWEDLEKVTAEIAGQNDSQQAIAKRGYIHGDN